MRNDRGAVLIQPRWWDAVIAAGVVVGVAITWFDAPAIVAVTGQASWPPWVAIGVIAASYVAFGRRALLQPFPTAAMVAFGAVLVVATGVGSFFVPSLATLQCVIYPLAWCVFSTAGAVIASSALAAAVFVAFMTSPVQQGQPGLFAESLGIAVLSLAFALTLGLWIVRIITYAQERSALLDQLTAAQDEIAAMHHQAGEVSERTRFARELHDTVTQSLTGLVMLAERAGAQLRAGEATDARDSVAVIEQTARDALAEARALVATMAPVASESGLADALRRLAARFERETGVAVATRVCEGAIPREQEVVLLRCAQEGLANVRKHARASRVAIDVTFAGGRTGEGAELTLRVRDDGVGVGVDVGVGVAELSDDAGFGIAGMRERVAMLGGRLVLASPPGGGAELAVTIPTAAAA